MLSFTEAIGNRRKMRYSYMRMDHAASEVIFKGLEAIWNTEFPKRCPVCGRVYETISDFLDITSPPTGSSGLVDLTSYDEQRQAVGLYRNCICGSTLMAFCSDRRDHSEAGKRRRELFGNLLAQLESTGIAHDVAREEVLRALRTGNTGMLRNLLSIRLGQPQ